MVFFKTLKNGQIRQETILSLSHLSHSIDSGMNVSERVVESLTVRNVLAMLAERERYLLIAVIACGYTYEELGAVEGKIPEVLEQETNEAVSAFAQIYTALE
jgi:hypothetical protein